MSRMSCRLLFLFLFSSGALCGGGEADTEASLKIDIPFQKFVLDNGLTLRLASVFDTYRPGIVVSV